MVVEHDLDHHEKNLLMRILADGSVDKKGFYTSLQNQVQIHITPIKKLSMVVHACNPSASKGWIQEDFWSLLV